MKASRAASIAILMCVLSVPARAEKLIVSVSSQRVVVTSNYAGEELVLFGSVERNGGAETERNDYDIVVTVKGPRTDMVTRRKERKFGIWVNAETDTFIGAPAYLAIFANRPFDTIAAPDVLHREQLGLNQVPFDQRPALADDKGTAFREAFIRLRAERGLYREDGRALTFLTPTLFRTGIPLPAEVPVGAYSIDTKLLAGGVVIAQTSTSFEIVKAGFEQFVTNSAREHGLLYGLATALMALMTGWLASVAFRRD